MTTIEKEKKKSKFLFSTLEVYTCPNMLTYWASVVHRRAVWSSDADSTYACSLSVIYSTLTTTSECACHVISWGGVPSELISPSWAPILCVLDQSCILKTQITWVRTTGKWQNMGPMNKHQNNNLESYILISGKQSEFTNASLSAKTLISGVRQTSFFVANCF